MFIKLTRFDNRPIWLNASFIVTVEPRKEGVGSVVVPIGDGFDYDVRETVQEILERLDGAPPAAVVPVPASDCLTKAPADVSPESESVRGPAADEARPARKPDGEKPGEEKKPRKRIPRKTKTEKAEKPADEKAEKPADAKAESLPPEPAAERMPTASLELSSDQIGRLVKLAPKSVTKLKNTLATQFHVADVGATVQALEAKGVFALDGTRVLWPVPPAAETPQM